jgi:hypothetical protein
METKEISETLGFSSTLTRLIARGYFGAFIRNESFKPYAISTHRRTHSPRFDHE